MSDTKTINRRMLLGQLAFSFAGATVLGTTMARCMREEWVVTATDMMEAIPTAATKQMTSEEIREGVEDYYDAQMGPQTKRLTTALGAMIGYVSHDEAVKPAPEPDIY